MIKLRVMDMYLQVSMSPQTRGAARVGLPVYIGRTGKAVLNRRKGMSSYPWGYICELPKVGNLATIVLNPS